MPIKHKFNAKMSECDGIKFSSKMERRYYEKLKLRKESGEVLFFLRQTPFHLPGNIRYLVDFVEFMSDDSVKFVDVKGFDTPVSLLKRKQVKDLFNVDIDVVTKI